MSAKLNYVELRGGDLAAAKRFYTDALGLAWTDYGPTYSAIEGGAVSVGLQGDPEEALSAPLPVVRVDDLDAAFDAVTKAGGHIAKPIFAFPGGRRFHFIDPGGNEIAVWVTA